MDRAKCKPGSFEMKYWACHAGRHQFNFAANPDPSLLKTSQTNLFRPENCSDSGFQVPSAALPFVYSLQMPDRWNRIGRRFLRKLRKLGIRRKESLAFIYDLPDQNRWFPLQAGIVVRGWCKTECGARITAVRGKIGRDFFPGALTLLPDGNGTDSQAVSFSIPVVMPMRSRTVELQVKIKKHGWKQLTTRKIVVRNSWEHEQKHYTWIEKAVGTNGRRGRKTPKAQTALLFAHELSRTGAPMMLFYLARDLSSSGWKVQVACPQKGPLASAFRRLGIPLHICPADPLENIERFAPLQGFDLLVFNTAVCHGMAAACMHVNTRKVWWIHDHEHGADILRQAPRSQRAYAAMEHVVFPCEATANLYAEFSKRPTALIPYGLPDPQDFLKSTRITASPPYKLVQMGTVISRKGQDIMLEALAQLSAHERSQLEVLWIGHPTDPAYAAKCRRESAALGCGRWLGDTPHSEALRILSSSDVLVMPSRDEVMPLAIIEAFALGKGVIASSVGGIPEMIDHQKNGLLFANGDSGELAAQLRYLLAHPEAISKFGKAARETYEERFQPRHMKNRFFRLMESDGASDGEFHEAC
jgi:glycosyltransferase involved in cell wall biosynthesis